MERMIGNELTLFKIFIHSSTKIVFDFSLVVISFRLIGDNLFIIDIFITFYGCHIS